jgi:acyl transferase domain-containing protein
LSSTAAPQLTRADATVGRRVGFLIAGVGEQYPGMVAALYADEPEFREDVDECLAPLGLTDPADLSDMFVPGASSRPTPQAHLIQPAVFVAEYATGHLVISTGSIPMTGLLECPTVRQLAELIDSAPSTEPVSG